MPDLSLNYYFSGFPPEELIEALKGVLINTQSGESRTYKNKAFSVGGYVAAMAANAECGDNLLETYIDMMHSVMAEKILTLCARWSANGVTW